MSDFDFGFTAVTEEELSQVQDAVGTAMDLQEKVNRLHSAIVPLLKNLKNNPEKDYIYWPNRLQKIEEFEGELDKILNS